MPNSAVGKAGHHTPNLWKDAYKALCDDEQGKDRLHKLNKKFREQLGKPKLNLRSEDGYKQLMGLINAKASELTSNKSSEKVGKICDNMIRIKDLVAAGVNVGGPYVAIPAAALFLAFSMNQIYRSEKEAMFLLAETVAHYTVLNAKSHERCKVAPGDDEDMVDMKKTLRFVYIGLYKTIILASAQLANFLYGDWQVVKNVMGHYDWGSLLKKLDKEFDLCVQYRDEMMARQKSPATAPKRDLRRAMGPGPRNPLHWAVALTVPERVSELVSNKEFPINALTPQSWTALHLAARQGNTKIIKTLLTAPGIDLRLVNKQGHTPLHIAALNNRVGAVKLILQRDERILKIRDGKGRTAFLLAARKGFVEVLKALKEYKQDVNEVTQVNGWSGLHLAAEQGHVDAVKYLVANGAKKYWRINAGKQKGLVAKQIAELEGKTELLEFL